MNKQDKGEGRRGIEWATYTWNPVGGCKHACRWQMPDGSMAICYAETVAEGVAHHAYPNGFQAHYWKPQLLDEPLKLQVPARIFLDSMADLMGHWVPVEQIQSVLDVCRQAHWHTFQLLTKNAPRLSQFTFPDNVWVGVSMPPTEMFGKKLGQNQQEAYIRRALDILGGLKFNTRWMSFEPLSFNVADILSEYDALPLEWAVIGAASNGKTLYQPKPQWVNELHWVLGRHHIPVFHKGNLDWRPHREEFPGDAAREIKSEPPEQLSLF